MEASALATGGADDRTGDVDREDPSVRMVDRDLVGPIRQK